MIGKDVDSSGSSAVVLGDQSVGLLVWRAGVVRAINVGWQTSAVCVGQCEIILLIAR